MNLDEIVGLTVAGVAGDKGSDVLTFTFTDGRVLKFWHVQDCCENVEISDVCGTWDDIVGSPLLMADEASHSPEHSGWESLTWTFYRFATAKGYVTVRWNGESNGYYSERVEYTWVAKP